MQNFGRRFGPVPLKSELWAGYYDAEFHKKVNEIQEYIRQQELEDVFYQT
jgi:hypothetical protein